ncbi:MAG: class I SAM-dependent methyltransferase [Deltaproteobacteria bacterium]|nr:class I SAM-dependent methyltransferase [Candidatus Zymogenaceae bacterium]
MHGRGDECTDPMNRVRRVFDTIAPWYRLFDRFSLPLYQELIGELQRHLPLTEHTRVLEVCCGTGFLSRMLAELCGRVVAVDISPRMIETAKKYDTTGAVDFRVADARDPLSPDDGPFDLVIESLGLHALDPEIRTDIMRKMYRHSRGHVLFIEPTGKGSPLFRAINHLLERLEGGYDNYRSFISLDLSEYLTGHGFIPRRLCLNQNERVAVYLCRVRREDEEAN